MIGSGTISNIYFLGPIKPKCFIRSQTASNPNFSKVFDLNKRNPCSPSNKIRACFWKSDQWLQSYARYTIFGPIAPKIITMSQSSTITKISEFNFCRMFTIKPWTRWDIHYNNQMIGYGAMSNIQFSTQLYQSILLDPTLFVKLDFSNYLI